MTAEEVAKSAATQAFVALKAQMYEALNANIGILSLTDTPLSEWMWGRYGDTGRGVVFEFDTSHRWLNQHKGRASEFYFPQQVNYVDLAADGRTFLNPIEENLLISKGLDWAREREWRVLAPLSEAVQVLPHPDGPIHLFDLDVGAVTAIIVGPKASAATVDAARRLTTTNPRLAHIQTRCVRATGGTLELADL